MISELLLCQEKIDLIWIIQSIPNNGIISHQTHPALSQILIVLQATKKHSQKVTRRRSHRNRGRVRTIEVLPRYQIVPNASEKQLDDQSEDKNRNLNDFIRPLFLGHYLMIVIIIIIQKIKTYRISTISGTFAGAEGLTKLFGMDSWIRIRELQKVYSTLI